MKQPTELYQAFLKAARPREFKLEDFCFDKQLAFVTDPESFATGVCGRRSGKTIACAADLIYTATQRPGVTCLYITLSRANAKRIIWPELLRINRHYKFGGHPDNTELSLSFANGSIIYASGAKDSSEIEKFRGLALALVYIDESQSFRPYIQQLIDDVIAPALFDYNGRLRTIGTPGPVPAGFFFEIGKSAQWSHHSWTMFDNPWLLKKSGKTPQELLERELKRRGVTVDDPTIQREVFAKWVVDFESLLFKYSEELNHYDKLPYTKANYVIGVDIGHDDADAIATIGWSEFLPEAYLENEIVTTKQGITELANQIQAEIARVGENSVLSIVMDTGGLGKKIAVEIRQRFGIPIEAAEKSRKFEYVELLNDAMRTRRFRAKKDSRFAQDCLLVEKEIDLTQPDKIKVSDKYHSDVCFVAGTLIATHRGEIPIEMVRVGDLALTRDGYRSVVASGKTGVESEVLELEFSNGSVLTCTPNHPIYRRDFGDFVAADALLYGHRAAINPAWENPVSLLYAQNSSELISMPSQGFAAALVRRRTKIGKDTVFNITVAGSPEYYANGVLVHNCDAVLYAFRKSLHWLSEPESPILIPQTHAWNLEQEKRMEERAEEMLREKLDAQNQWDEWGN